MNKYNLYGEVIIFDVETLNSSNARIPEGTYAENYSYLSAIEWTSDTELLLMYEKEKGYVEGYEELMITYTLNDEDYGQEGVSVYIVSPDAKVFDDAVQSFKYYFEDGEIVFLEHTIIKKG